MSQLLTDEFISKYPEFPEHMSEIGKFVYYRTYSRYLSELKRRETWKETCRRAVEYNCSLASTSREEAQKLFDNMFNLRQAVSGRTLWVGGTEVARRYPLANFNCSFVVMDEIEAITDLFYLLMVGTGVGFRILKSDVEKLPVFRTDVQVIHKEYVPLSKDLRLEHTELTYRDDDYAVINIGDSKEGWVEALATYLNIMTQSVYRHIRTIEFIYDSVRPKGERLKLFGGTASGHESLKTMFTKIHNVITTDKYAPKPEGGKLRPIHLLDICNIIGENVVVGGVRRTSEIALLDPTDVETIEAKSNLTPEMYHRFMSNNSIFYEQKPTREQFAWQFQVLRDTGEPCFVNAEQARKRNPYFQGVNPCVEILLDNRQTCNLTTINLMAFVKDGKLLETELLEAQRMSARAGLRMTCVTLELKRWDEKQKRDRLLGCSVTGWKDAMEALNYTMEQEIELQALLGRVAREEADKYAEELGISKPLLVTAVKPEGTISQVFGAVSSGLHHAHSPYYIRRIRINATDPLCKVAEFLDWDVRPENGQGIEVDGEITPISTKVISFPVKSPVKRTKYDVSAIEQFQTYLNFQSNYTEHNSSNTISVKDDEWKELEEAFWEHWDDVVAVSFLKLDGHVYAQAPYEAIDEETYLKMRESMVPFHPETLELFEDTGEDFDLEVLDAECSTGACPIR